MLKISFFALLISVCLNQAPPTNTGTTTISNKYMSFDEFITKFHKSYKSGSEEYSNKKKIYEYNIAELIKKNCDVCGVTKFFDIAPAQFEKKILNLDEKKNPVSSKLPEPALKKLAAPRTFDWRNYGVVTSIKDQGECGCCWSFATVAMSESSLILKGEAKKNVDLSQQYLLRCTPDSDCGGGFIENAVDTILKYGSPDEDKYPYQPYEYTSSTICLPRLTNEQISQKPRQSFYDIDTLQIKDIVVSGPVAIAISATNWEYYSGGIWKCRSTDEVNHAVLLVGWTEDAWIIKNQWGSDWGEQGYIRVSMDPRQNCKIGVAVHMLSESITKYAAILLTFLIIVFYM